MRRVILVVGLMTSVVASIGAQESSSPHYSNISLGGSPTAATAPERAIPRRTPITPPIMPAPATSAAPARPESPAAPIWPWTALGVGIVLAVAVRARSRQSTRQRAADETLALAAHELKSPLAAIESYLDLMVLEAPEDSRNARHWLEDARHMKSTAAHLRRTIGDMLDMTRIEDGRMKLSPQSLPLGPLLTEAAAVYAANARARNVGLVVDAPADLPEARIDPDRMRQVLHNLLGNALKYTPNGKTVFLGARREGQELLVEVRDEGVGVPLEKRARLFGKFSRLAPALDGTEGTGLGLYISRRLVEAQGGRLVYASGPEGRGSVFRIALPGGGKA